MATLYVPLGIGDLDAPWLTSALAPLASGARVADVTSISIGSGATADSRRLALSWDRPTSAPAGLVAKLPARDPVIRAAAAATRAYELEATFYNELADTLAVHRPDCYLARFDPATHGYVVLLQDLTPVEAGDPRRGCTPDDAATVIPELVGLHAPRWSDDRLLELSWLERPDHLAARPTAELVAALFPGFVERYAARVDPEVLALTGKFMTTLGTYLSQRSWPWSVVHGGFRLDNLLFGGPRVAVVDWGRVRIGDPLSDVACFVGSALTTEDRRVAEVDLVRSYWDGLRLSGVNLAWDTCWDGYRRSSFDGLIMGISGAMLGARTARGDDLFVALVNRHGHQAIDLDAESLVGDPPT